MDFAERLSRAREAAGLSKAELARRIGVPRQLVDKWEARKNLPGLENALAISRELGVTVNELFGDAPTEVTELRLLLERMPKKARECLLGFLQGMQEKE